MTQPICKYRKLIFIFLIVFTHPALSVDSKPYAPKSIENVLTVSAEEAIEIILSNPGMVIIDSRKKTEFLKGHIEGSINILNTDLERENLERLSPDKSKAILFYCNGERCLRSSEAIKKAKSWGYSQLIWFRGGWNEWSEKRLPAVSE